MPKRHISCVGDFLKIVNDVAKNNGNRQLYFRGQSDASWGVSSTLCRFLNSNNIKKLSVKDMRPDFALKIMHSRLATELFNSFKARFVLYSEVNIIKGYELDDIDLHVMAQHYQLPTRMIDLTRNPLISLYFATEGSTTSRDVAVFILKGGYNEESGSVFLNKIEVARQKYLQFYKRIKPYTYHEDGVMKVKLDEVINFINGYAHGQYDLKRDIILSENESDPDHIALSYTYSKGLKDYLKISRMLNDFVKDEGFNYSQSHSSISIYNSMLQIISPLPINQRIKNQQGLLLFSNIINEPIFEDAYFTENNTIRDLKDGMQDFSKSDFLKVVIKKKHVNAIKAELERYGVTREFIYPELQEYTNYMKNEILKKYI
ncbi:FRG domain-containing protein [Erwinia papayae]|uniref:FRG domain-containing protein n=1 Tax=Erwinia papayae TaxID=206499 RepID=A0ABV3MYG5_9GAMM